MDDRGDQEGRRRRRRKKRTRSGKRDLQSLDPTLVLFRSNDEVRSTGGLVYRTRKEDWESALSISIRVRAR